MLLISSVKTLFLSLLNLCRVFDIDLLFLTNYLFFSRLSMLILFFFRYFILSAVFIIVKFKLCLLLFYPHILTASLTIY